MRISLITILFSTLTFSQGVEITSVTHSVVSGYSAYYQMKDRTYYASGETELKKRYNSYWHTTGGVELGLSIYLGMQIEKQNDDLLGVAKDVVLFSAIRWLLRDGTYNMLNGNPFFHQSNNTTAKLEPYGFWYVKLSYLVLAILWKYL